MECKGREGLSMDGTGGIGWLLEMMEMRVREDCGVHRSYMVTVEVGRDS